MDRRFRLITIALCVGVAGLVSLTAGTAGAQFDILSGKRLLQRGRPTPTEFNASKVTVRASILPGESSQSAKLAVTAQIAPDWHIYSITQAPDGPVKTKIKLNPSKQYRLTGGFTANPAPEPHSYPDIWPGLAVEEHTREVTWEAPIELLPGVSHAELKIGGAVNAQACADACIPPRDYAFTAGPSEAFLRGEVTAPPAGQTTAARVTGQSVSAQSRAEPPAGPFELGAAFDPIAAAGETTFQRGHVAIRGVIQPSSVAPGGKARLTLTAEPAPQWHIYALADRDPQQISKPTLIEIVVDSGLELSRPKAIAKPTVKLAEGAGSSAESFYTREVSWTLEITVPADAQAGEFPIVGLIGFQTCKEGLSCDQPSAARFEGTLRVASSSDYSSSYALTFMPAKYPEAARVAAGRTPVEAASSAQPKPAAEAPTNYEIADAGASSLPLMILFSLVGGLILNLMPCVLPVIGLKVLAFVEQSGHSRSRVVLLNLWYTAGIMTVFMVLATLAATLNFRWGQQFSSSGFNIAMASVVFAMALSFLGFWEIPIPGFVGTGSAVKMAAREGSIGAFAKGVLTTILATPCSGPFLGAVFGFTLQQPPLVIYLIYGSIGLGMASPYLLLGAFPRLVRRLPKPGVWMETFKQLMAFVLLGTVVFMFTFLDRDYLVPTFALLIGIWAACWWIGRTPLTESFRRRGLAWLEGAAFAAVVGSFAFTWLVPRAPLLEWQPFSRPTLAQLTAEGKTVMIDFTAEWCPNCKFNMATAINTQGVREIVQENGVVPMLADWTDAGEEVGQMLESLHSASIPVLAIFPAGKPNQPIVLRDVISQRALIEALKRAGPSRDTVGGVGRKASGSALTGRSGTPPAERGLSRS
jgi:suppressor for copper-sensitivity B